MYGRVVGEEDKDGVVDRREGKALTKYAGVTDSEVVE